LDTLQSSLKHQRPLFWCGVKLIFSLILAPYPALAAITWSQQDDTGNNIYFSSEHIPLIPVTQSGNHHTPSLFYTGTDAYIAWVDNSSAQQSVIRVVKVHPNGMVQNESLPISFEAKTILEPSIYYEDETGVLWVIWSQFDGESSDLWISNKVDTVWSDPIQVTPKDQYTAALPQILDTSKNTIQVSWLQSSQQDSHVVTSWVEVSDKGNAIATIVQTSSKKFSSVQASLRSLQRSSDATKIITQLAPHKNIWSASEHSAISAPERLHIEN